MTSLVLGMICFGLAVSFLPMLLINPRKFSLLFSLGSAFTLSSFSFLWGPYNHLVHLLSRERLPFTSIYLSSLILTLYFAMGLQSAILTPIAACAQVIFKSKHISKLELDNICLGGGACLVCCFLHSRGTDWPQVHTYHHVHSVVSVTWKTICPSSSSQNWAKTKRTFFPGLWQKCVLASAEVQWIRTYQYELPPNKKLQQYCAVLKDSTEQHEFILCKRTISFSFFIGNHFLS